MGERTLHRLLIIGADSVLLQVACESALKAGPELAAIMCVTLLANS
jgi:hypothetical protein